MKKVTVLAAVVLLLTFVVGVSAQDELLSLEAPDCDYGGLIRSVVAVDPDTVQFTLCATDPAFESKMAHPAMAIHPSEYLLETNGQGELFTAPIGTGPYRLERWDLGNELVLTRNEDYWGEPAIEPTAILRWNSEAAARLTELRAGTIDGMENVGVEDIPVLRMDPNFQLLDRAPLTGVYVAITNTFAPLDDVRVRQAIAHAIDRQRLVDNFFPDGSLVGTGFVPPAVFGSIDSVETLPYDPELARALLEEAAADLGFELPLTVVVNAEGEEVPLTLSYRDVVRAYLPTPGIIATDIAEQLREVGIEVQVVVKESGTFIEQSLAGNEPLHLLGWTADYPDGNNFLDPLFAPTVTQLGNIYPEITDPLVAAGREMDPDVRLELFTEVAENIRDLAPIVPFGHGASATAWQPDIVGAHTSPLDGNVEFALIEDPDDDNIVYMQNAEPIRLYCNDTSDGESFRACHQINEQLLDFVTGTTEIEPGLAESWESNEDGTVWTFNLRDNVTFHDGSTLDANDVVQTFIAMGDASSPLHEGSGEGFVFYGYFFSEFINAE